MTIRERLGEHLSNPSCASCHNLIDPIGFGLEKFDAIGRRMEKVKVTVLPAHVEKDKKPFTVELPDRQLGPASPGFRIRSSLLRKELGRVLAGSPQCQECVVKQLFRYQAGRLETPADRELIRRSYEDFRASQFRFQALIIA